MLLYNVLRPYCPCIVVARRGSPWPVVRKVSVEWTLVRSSFEYLGVCPPLNHSSHCISGAFLLEREIDLDDLLEAGALELLRLAAPPSPPSTIAYDEIPLAGPIRPYLILIRDSEAGSFTAAKEEEISELQTMFRNCCYIQPVKGGYENSHGKVNILLQAYISVSPSNILKKPSTINKYIPR